MSTLIPNRHTFDLPSRLAADVSSNTKYFNQHREWTARLLQHPEYEPVPVYVRIAKPTGEDSFFGGIINNPSTVTNMLCLRRRDLSLADIPPLNTKDATDREKVSARPDRSPDVMFVFSLAREGLQGHPQTAHGGFLNVLFDEMLGQTLMCHFPPTSGIGGGDGEGVLGPDGRPLQEWLIGEDAVNSKVTGNSVKPTSTSTSTSTSKTTSTRKPATDATYVSSGGTLFTANLSVDFRAPVRLPGTFVYRGWATGRERRKSWVVGEIVGVVEGEAGAGVGGGVEGTRESEGQVKMEMGVEGAVAEEGKREGTTNAILHGGGKVLATATSTWVATFANKI